VTGQPVWFGPADRRLFGWLGHPDSGPGATGVLLCPPIGVEALAAYRALQQLALRLNAIGLSTLLLDYDGTGDSAGDVNDAGRVEAWIGSIGAGAAHLRSAGALGVSAVGMRLGANLAAAATSSASLDALVLWDPCVSGASFLREQISLSAYVGGDSSNGAIDAPDLYYEARTARDIRSNLGPLQAPAGDPRMLVLVRPDRPFPHRLHTALDAADAEWGEAAGQDRLIGVPVEQGVVPHAAVDEIACWLGRDVGGRREAAPVDAAKTAGHPDADEPTESTAIERPVALGPARLFGIATEPHALASETVVLFVNVANERHLGPARGWVRLARTLAAQGIRSVRLDLSGVGDSPARPGRERDVVYEPEWLTDLTEAVEALAPAPIVLVGLCSGAYSALECALSTRVRGVCVVNPILDIEWLAPPSPLWDTRRRALRVMPRSLRRVASRHRRVAETIWRLVLQVAVRRDPAHVLVAAARRGTDVLVVASPENVGEFRRGLFWRCVGLPWSQRTRRLRIEVVDALDHSADCARGREAALQAIADHVLARHVQPATHPVAAPRRRALRLASVISTSLKELA
jgi:alpha-beta hydrolase superfamily lysophospholipase